MQAVIQKMKILLLRGSVGKMKKMWSSESKTIKQLTGQALLERSHQSPYLKIVVNQENGNQYGGRRKGGRNRQIGLF